VALLRHVAAVASQWVSPGRLVSWDELLRVGTPARRRNRCLPLVIIVGGKLRKILECNACRHAAGVRWVAHVKVEPCPSP
jgi:hypothetical protein